ncbi:hypothetical protein [Desulfobacula sp.]|uniref:hypothetical protein n=1 Tax=Desulfobacula sp. TaxID=2593537 RepID=UPI00260C7992|nr:hypothetical protein [Desulfobacula sp.]
MTEEKNQAKTEKSPTLPAPAPALAPAPLPAPAPAPKSRGAFYYLDGFLVRLSLLVLIIALLWNWDGFWRTDIKFLTDAQKNYFPDKYEAEHLKIAALDDKSSLFTKMNERIVKYEEEKNQSLKSVEEVEAELVALKKEAAVLLRHYDTSLRIIKQLNRKFSPDEFEETLKCNSPECENILKSNPEADPTTYSFN